MQSSQMFPAAQTRTGNQVQGSQGYGQHHPQPPVVSNHTPYGSAPQVHHVGQQVFSTPPQHGHSTQFPSVIQHYSAQPFPSVQVPSHVQQYPQPTYYSAQVVKPQPQVFGQGHGPMFSAAKDRK